MSAKAAKIVWKSGLRFNGTGSGTGVPVAFDSPSGGEKPEGATPMEVLLMAAGACTGMDVISILGKMRQDVTAYEIEVRGEQADEYPKVYKDIVVEHIVTGRGLDPSLVQKAVRLSETKYCSVSNTLSLGVKVSFTFRIIEAADARGTVARRPKVASA